MEEDIKTIKLAFVNVFLVNTGDGFILIDSGLSTHWEELEKELISAGCFPDKLKLIILTHGDYDHTGNCRKLREKYNIKTAIQRADCSIIETGSAGKRKKKLSQVIRFLIPSLLMKLHQDRLNANKFIPDIFLTDGQDLREYNFNARVIYTPGHTKGSISILTESGNLFVGDTLVNNRRPAPANIIENSEDLNTSITELKKLCARMIYPGHGEAFSMESFLKYVS